LTSQIACKVFGFGLEMARRADDASATDLAKISGVWSHSRSSNRCVGVRQRGGVSVKFVTHRSLRRARRRPAPKPPMQPVFEDDSFWSGTCRGRAPQGAGSF
jgi:hypothetical protein